MTSGVYKIVHIDSGRMYVGSSYVISRRWNRHKRELSAGIHPNAKLQNAWAKYGAAAFEFVIIEECAECDAVVREQFWMDRMDVIAKGFNLAPKAASFGGIIPSAETREKMAAAKRGIPRSAETRAKISAFQQTRGPLSAEIRERIAAANRGSKRSDDAKRKMSAKAKTRAPQSDETKAKRSAAMKAAWAEKREH